jgi:hypothetical protein
VQNRKQGICKRPVLHLASQFFTILCECREADTMCALSLWYTCHVLSTRTCGNCVNEFGIEQYLRFFFFESPRIVFFGKTELYKSLTHTKSRDSSVGIALGYGLNDRGSRVRFPAGAVNFSHHRVQNGSGAHPASYPMRTRGSFPGGKSVVAWSWPLTSI